MAPSVRATGQSRAIDYYYFRAVLGTGPRAKSTHLDVPNGFDVPSALWDYQELLNDGKGVG